MSNLTQSQLKEFISYDRDSGKFTWIKSPSRNIKVGSEAGTIHITGYVYIRFLNKQYRAHRLAWFYVYGVWPKDQLDHIKR